MYFTQFYDREDYLARLRAALDRDKPQFIVIYGRRRIGKSALIRHLTAGDRRDIYFLSDQTAEAHQRALFAQSAATVVEGFDEAVYSDWETLLRALSRQLSARCMVCLDEFPYMVKACPSLPSIIQKLLNERVLRFDLMVCGSSQQLMQCYVRDRHEPLYGLADEIVRLTPLPAAYIAEALHCGPVEAVEEYAVWGGIPRYWELRADYPDRQTAIRALLLDPKGFLVEEPLRLLRDDMRDTAQSATLLSVIGNGAARLSEIAARVERPAPQLSEALGRLRELGYIRRETPFGEDEKKSRRGLYYINDPLIAFNYRFVAPYRSLLEMGGIDAVADRVRTEFPQFVGRCWEGLCRRHISGRTIGDVTYNVASRWWGRLVDGRMAEVDLVAESLDRRHVLIGECKWTDGDDAARQAARLSALTGELPFIKEGQTVHTALFLKRPTMQATGEAMTFLPADVLG